MKTDREKRKAIIPPLWIEAIGYIYSRYTAVMVKPIVSVTYRCVCVYP